MQCFLFEPDNIIKEENGEWFEWDRKRHAWIPEEVWEDIFREELLDVMAIQYDCSTERITFRRALSGRALNEDLLYFEEKHGRSSGESMHYYLFEYGCIVRDDGIFWCQRDRKRHRWILAQGWMDRYLDAAYPVIEIEYDEKNETITDRREIPGYGTNKELMDFVTVGEQAGG